MIDNPEMDRLIARGDFARRVAAAYLSFRSPRAHLGIDDARSEDIGGIQGGPRLLWDNFGHFL